MMRAAVAAVAAIAMLATASSRGAVPREVVQPSGLRLWEIPTGNEERFALAVVVDVGARDETEGSRGITHVLEHAVFLGPRSLSAADLLDEFRRRDVQFNGETSSETTVFSFDCPLEQADWLIPIVGAMIAQPALRDDDVAREIEVVLEELDGRGADIEIPTIEKELYPHHGLTLSAGGTTLEVRGLDATQLAVFHAAHYRAGSMAVAWADDPEDGVNFEAAIATAFAVLRPGVSSSDRHGPEPRTGTWTAPDLFPLERSSSGRAGYVVAGHHVRRRSPETFAAMLIAERLLYDECFRTMRTEQPLAYFTGVDFVPHSDAWRLEFNARVSDNGKLPAVVEALDVATKRLQRVEKPTFVAAREAAAAQFESAANGPQLAVIAGRLWLLARTGTKASLLDLEIQRLTRDRFAAIVRTELGPDSAYCISNSIMLALPPDAGRIAAIVAGALAVVALAASFGPRALRRARMLLHDATARLRLRLLGRRERERMMREVDDILKGAGRPKDPPGGDAAPR